MTILPLKKKRERDSSQRPPNSHSSVDHRANVAALSANAAMRRNIRKSPRPHEKSMPPAKRAMLSSSSAHNSPLSSPRSTKPEDKAALPVQHQSVASSSNQQGSSTNDNDNNSDDEYDSGAARDEELEREFSERLRSRGLIIKEMEGDGACMFRAIAEQVYGDQEMHGQVRKLCMDYMVNNRDYFSDFITEDFSQYVERKRVDTVHGNHVELQAISEMFARPVEVYQYSDEPINILLPRGINDESSATSSTQSASSNQQQNAPLRLSYHGAVHYNAIVDPNAATIGVGLGLPGMVAGGADTALLTDAMRTSEKEHIEETMLKDKIDMTDWQRTQADLEEAIARESYMTYVRDTEKKEVEKARASADDKEATSTSDEPSTSGGNHAGLYEELLAAQSLDWETYNEDVAMAEALLLSQQEFVAAQQGPSGSQNP